MAGFKKQILYGVVVVGCWLFGLFVVHLWQRQTPLPRSVPIYDRAQKEIQKHQLALIVGSDSLFGGSPRVSPGDRSIVAVYAEIDAGKSRESPREALMDPWGNPYQVLVSNGADGRASFSVYSLGMDGEHQSPSRPQDDIGFADTEAFVYYLEQYWGPTLRKRDRNMLIWGSVIGLISAYLIIQILSRKFKRHRHRYRRRRHR